MMCGWPWQCVVIRYQGFIKAVRGTCWVSATYTMSLLRSLLFAVVVVCTAPLCAAQWPCPDSGDIAPCVCTSNTDYEITMDCSDVVSSDSLAEVFQTPFAFNDFKQLIIQPATAHPALLELQAGVFGPVTFKEVDITGTNIHTVREEAFVNSHETLERLNLGGNQISAFPTETVDLYIVLQELDISYNMLSGTIVDVVSESLYYLDMSGNTGLLLTETVFQGAALLEELRLSNMALGDTSPANMFLTLKYLRTLYLENNEISGTLIEDFINTDLDPLITVNLDGNLLTQIHPLSVTGMNVEGTISFRNNQIEELPQENWEGLISQLSLKNSIDLRDNPLVCGCDILWLVSDSVLMSFFHEETTCVTGNYIVDLPLDWFLQHCP